MIKSFSATYRLWLGIGLTLVAATRPYIAAACAAAFQPGLRVEIAAENAVIVWDATHKTEHFIRQATFDTAAKDLGFLVPTPDTPTLAEADAQVFSQLTPLMEPEVRTEVHREYTLTSWLFPQAQLPETTDTLAKAAAMPRASYGAVRVLKSQQVAGYDAVVLEADKIEGLTRWLKAHDYTARPALMEWLKPYVAAHWKITAFKIAKKEAEAGQVDSALVRMSFATESPVYPYREPADQRDPNQSYSPRLLRVFLFSAARMEGALGEAGAEGSWSGQVTWADQVAEERLTVVAKQLALPADQFAGTKWLTVFEDRASPRMGTDDVYFATSKSQVRLVPPPIIHTREEKIEIPVELPVGMGIFVVGLLGSFHMTGRNRRRRDLREIEPL